MTRAIPEGLHSVTPQMNLDGAAEAIETYKKAFGAVELMRAPDPSGKKIWHASLRIGDSTIFVNDTQPEMGALATKQRAWIYAEKVDDAFQRALGAGLTAKQPPMDMFWGDRIAMVGDRWGNEWVLATHLKDLSPEEMKKAEQDFVAQMAKRTDPQ
jgi:uncharacterized glyoxalase superfamily protein PhnB